MVLKTLTGCCCLLLCSAVAERAALGAQQAEETGDAKRTVTVELSPTQCRRLTRHEPSADVAFQPGVDARGRPVAPVDLNADGQGYVPRIEPPKRIVIPIEIDLFDRFGIPVNPALFEADAQVGEVVYENGKLYYNGQRLADGASDEIIQRCRERLEAETAIPR
ncbi:hypothetical protein [Pelagibius sp. Alg239-R121]|uniref:hypothetical protein n=1 Tax=Pelagibius sp. Alg239-R121 TaxID=2993448 RepID=UPI0024A744D0|nr:hypothetical protein [Pelagibius sp. Alg239-R121]